MSGGGGGGESGSESGGGAGFSRDAVGRRSMSEKRHAAMDAKQTGTYRKIKETKAINCESSFNKDCIRVPFMLFQDQLCFLHPLTCFCLNTYIVPFRTVMATDFH